MELGARLSSAVVAKGRKVDRRKVCAYQYIGLSFILPKTPAAAFPHSDDDDDDADFASNFDNVRAEGERGGEMQCST